MSYAFSDQFGDELNPGERIIWSGQPQQGLVLRAADWFLVPFSLVWGGFCLFFEYSAATEGAPLPAMIFGIPFLLVGLYIIFGRFFLDMEQRRRTYYALTNERAVIVGGLLHHTIKSISIKYLPEISVSIRRNGQGTITFGASHPLAWMYAGSGFPNMGPYHAAPSFEMIDDVKTVYQHVKALRRGGS
ncbi:MAG TPA: hypothetical protein VLZ89_02935 [Anaerolineales bacterium]|nr:hypothetical protein [Anaerolineales bacterium]